MRLVAAGNHECCSSIGRRAFGSGKSTLRLFLAHTVLTAQVMRNHRYLISIMEVAEQEIRL